MAAGRDVHFNIKHGGFLIIIVNVIVVAAFTTFNTVAHALARFAPTGWTAHQILLELLLQANQDIIFGLEGEELIFLVL